MIRVRGKIRVRGENIRVQSEKESRRTQADANLRYKAFGRTLRATGPDDAPFVTETQCQQASWFPRAVGTDRRFRGVSL